MDCLELNIHQLILSDIASNVDSEEDLKLATDLITSKVRTREEPPADGEPVERTFMSASTVYCHIAFGELVSNFPEKDVSDSITTIVPALVDVLDDIPYIDFDRNLSWEEWALPDQLVYSTVSALLRISSLHSDYVPSVVDAIGSFIEASIENIKNGSNNDVLTQFSPSIHGLYRAIISTPFAWSASQWRTLSSQLDTLFSIDVIDRLNNILTANLDDDDTDDEVLDYMQTLLARYISRGRPLSGYFIACCVIETQWTVLAQVLAPPEEVDLRNDFDGEAEAANRAWSMLMRNGSTVKLDIVDKPLRDALKRTEASAMRCFSDLVAQMQEMDSAPIIDTYASETISESLKLSSVCSIALREVDLTLHSHLMSLLSDQAPVIDPLVQEAALQATNVLVQSFREIASPMATHLRKFVTSPITIFDFEFASEHKTPPVLAASARCLAFCIKLAPGDNLIMSNMYSLLNYIAATSMDPYESSQMNSPYGNSSSGRATPAVQVAEGGLKSLSDEEKRLVGISTIAVVSKLALEFKTDEVLRLTVSMLLQRLRTADAAVEAVIAYHLVDLALYAPSSSFADIIRAFSNINRSANPDDPRFSNNMVLAAQTRLAQMMDRRPELYDVYLVELLALFADKGVAIQNIAISKQQVKTDDMIEQLASLLLPIDALLEHTDFNPQLNPSLEMITLFRNMWFLCALFHFSSDEANEGSAMEWQRPALQHIATKTPALVIEEAHDSIANDVEYNTVIRQEFANTVITKHRNSLLKHISLRSSEIRFLSSGQIVFLHAMHDIETMRAASGLPSSLVTYFINPGLNKHANLIGCMESIAEKIIRNCIGDLNVQVSQQAIPDYLSKELQSLLVWSTHRIEKARDVAFKYLDRLITSFPSLMCDPPLVVAILEVLTLLQHACEDEFNDEYNPVHEYQSDRTEIKLQLTDDYRVRNDILVSLQRSANNWFELALSRAPIELQSTLQKYLAVNQTSGRFDSTELGASIAERFGKAVGPVQRQLTSLAFLSRLQTDQAKVLTNQIASKAYFVGEAAGLRLANREVSDKIEKLPPQVAPLRELMALKSKMEKSLQEIRSKTSVLTVQDLKRLLFRCGAFIISNPEPELDLLHYIVSIPFEIASPQSVSTGIDAWTWIIAERPELEVALMSEILSAWSESIRLEKGVFSTSLNYMDPFNHGVEYSPTDQNVMDRVYKTARRLLTPHTLVLQMLLSRMQTARYRKSDVMHIVQQLILRTANARLLMSTHPLAREFRFSFVLFGFETLKSSRLDAYCENVLRQCLYSVAYEWFAVRPQWTYGASRVQIDADVKILSEFLSYLQRDTVRGSFTTTSLSVAQSSARISQYIADTKSINLPLRLLVENEIARLMVWNNPANDARRGMDYPTSIERNLTESQWAAIARTVWNINPAISVHLVERFKGHPIGNEVVKLVRSGTVDVLDTSEALAFLVGDHLEGSVRRDLRHLLLWAPVPPVIAVTFFERKYQNDPIILQYAHRVLEQHPVELTFFFIPQVVQALRHDDLGYVSRFILETTKISQLFCHQIIWNMKANCYKDDLAEVEDPLKPTLDAMTDIIVNTLSGVDKEFYDREFGFFNEVTSISGKLKPFIKASKPEKKAKIDEEMAKIKVEVGVYLPSNPDGIVVDIDKKSGRPLQSHAKAPFMATFKVRKQRTIVDTPSDSALDVDGPTKEVKTEYDTWQQAIFKVGDDCRQDVLALQVIAMFKNIFASVGLPLYLFPYRVTATAPGCGVIDVVPNATSRDELGRAKVNDLLGFFIAKYGGEDTIAFQKARLNFIQSMAAYSVACYILQIKDRHNGNIMIDGHGHIVHIDFGFLFDIDNVSFYLIDKWKNLLDSPPFHGLCNIRPGGVKFEPNSFKLNHEMIMLMGGRNSQGYQLFQHLTIKAFLAIRPYTDQLVNTVQLMLETGLPSFKGEPTIKRLRDRFVPGHTERQAADWMASVIRNAYENVRSTAYDEFQRLQNGIPYN